MPTQNIHVLSDVVSLGELCDVVAELQKQVRYLQENIDVENIIKKSLTAEVIKAGTLTADEIAANAITADKINVNELSAISANLGTIFAGLIYGISIYGSYIATAAGTYPRCEMNSSTNEITVYFDENNFVKMVANSSGTPVISFSANSGALTGKIGLDTSLNRLLLHSNRRIDILPASDNVYIPSWARLYSESAGQSLQTALNAKANVFSGYTGSVAVDGKTLSFSNGILTGVV